MNSQQLCEFLALESVNSSPILARQWWRHFRLSLSLSLYYRKRGSASYIVREVLLVRERQREIQRKRDRRKWRHHCRAKIGDEFTLPLPKIRTIGDELTLSLAKSSHFSFLPSHFPSLPSRKGHHSGAEIRNEFTLSIAINFFALRLCSPLFQMARAARRVIENPRQMIKSCPVLFCSFHRKTESNNTKKLLEIEKEIVREVARGDKPYLRKSTDRKAQIRKPFVQFSGLICALRSVDFLR